MILLDTLHVVEDPVLTHLNVVIRLASASTELDLLDCILIKISAIIDRLAPLMTFTIATRVN